MSRLLDIMLAALALLFTMTSALPLEAYLPDRDTSLGTRSQLMYTPGMTATSNGPMYPCDLHNVAEDDDYQDGRPPLCQCWNKGLPTAHRGLDDAIDAACKEFDGKEYGDPGAATHRST